MENYGSLDTTFEIQRLIYAYLMRSATCLDLRSVADVAHLTSAIFGLDEDAAALLSASSSAEGFDMNVR